VVEKQYPKIAPPRAQKNDVETAPMDCDVQMDRSVSMNEPESPSYHMNRRSSLFGVSGVAAGLATVVAANISLPVGPARAAADPNKVVAVPYTPYQVTSDSSAESIEVAKQLKAAGARLYGAFWCENCNKQKELLGKQAMEYVDYVECFPNGVYQNSPGHDDVTKPDAICTGYTSAWPLWVVPKQDGEPGDEIGIQGQIKKPKELQRLVKEAAGQKFDAVKYLTSGSDGYETGVESK